MSSKKTNMRQREPYKTFEDARVGIWELADKILLSRNNLCKFLHKPKRQEIVAVFKVGSQEVKMEVKYGQHDKV